MRAITNRLGLIILILLLVLIIVVMFLIMDLCLISSVGTPAVNMTGEEMVCG